MLGHRQPSHNWSCPVPSQVPSTIIHIHLTENTCNLTASRRRYTTHTPLWTRQQQILDHSSKEQSPNYIQSRPSQVVGLTNGYHTAAVMATKGVPVHAKRLCHASGIRMQLQAAYVRADGEPSHCYCQIDGEPWVQNVPSGRDDRPVQVRGSHRKLLWYCSDFLAFSLTPSQGCSLQVRCIF